MDCPLRHIDFSWELAIGYLWFTYKGVILKDLYMAYWLFSAVTTYSRCILKNGCPTPSERCYLLKNRFEFVASILKLCFFGHIQKYNHNYMGCMVDKKKYNHIFKYFYKYCMKFLIFLPTINKWGVKCFYIIQRTRRSSMAPYCIK